MKKPGLLDLRPTQFVLGMREIEFKIAKIEKFSKAELQDYCDDHQIPVVIGPKGEPFLIDHHHFARACYETQVDTYSIKVIKNLQSKNEKDFWNFMVREGWVYLNDQFGVGPHSPQALPSDIRCLADDPFRSLTWEMLNAGVIKKQDIPFFEFQWAAFFRFNLDRPLHSKSDFKEVIALAKKLSRSKDASHLPGYLNK